MKLLGILFLLLPSPAFAWEGTVPDREISLGGVVIGDSSSVVIERLGQPHRKVKAPDFLDLHYDYPNMRVSFSDGIVAGLYSDKPDGCTPMHLCPGDSLDRMHSLYGPPLVANRESGRFFEYHGADTACWIQIPATGKRVESVTVACQP